jgi:hypothetical protein
LKRIERKVDISLRALSGLAFTAFDAYGNRTQTSAGINKQRHEQIRNNYYDHCGITKNPNDAGKSLAYCVLTGRTGEGREDTLKLAHLVPASAPASILKTLK